MPHCFIDVGAQTHTHTHSSRGGSTYHNRAVPDLLRETVERRGRGWARQKPTQLLWCLSNSIPSSLCNLAKKQKNKNQKWYRTEHGGSLDRSDSLSKLSQPSKSWTSQSWRKIFKPWNFSPSVIGYDERVTVLNQGHRDHHHSSTSSLRVPFISSLMNQDH